MYTVTHKNSDKLVFLFPRKTEKKNKKIMFCSILMFRKQCFANTLQNRNITKLRIQRNSRLLVTLEEEVTLETAKSLNVNWWKKQVRLQRSRARKWEPLLKIYNYWNFLFHTCVSNSTLVTKKGGGAEYKIFAI